MLSPRQQPTGRADDSDAELVPAARTGDVRALAALYTRYGARLMAVAYRLLFSAQDAEDVLHDVFVGLPEALRRYDERGTLEAWLKRVTARVALTRLRQEHAGRQVSIDSATLPTPSSIDHDAAITLRSAVAALPPSLRSVLVLKEIEGFTHAEIGEMLGISTGASEVRLHRAHRLLRTALSEGEQS
jgi:RNA polymerase sigma-70 factor (ECF subfamily)